MKFDALKFDLQASRSTIAFQWLLLAGLIALSLILAIGWLSNTGRQHTVIVPPAIHKTFWIENDKASPEYLEQMAYFLSTLILNVQPGTVDYQNKVLLQYVSPAGYKQLEADGKQAGERVKREQVSQWFTPREFKVNEGGLQAAMIGQLQTFVGNSRISDALKAYVAEFEFLGGRVALKSFREVHPDDPFNPKKSPDAAGAAVAAALQR